MYNSLIINIALSDFQTILSQFQTNTGFLGTQKGYVYIIYIYKTQKPTFIQT
jgi:hypothetical protein